MMPRTIEREVVEIIATSFTERFNMMDMQEPSLLAADAVLIYVRALAVVLMMYASTQSDLDPAGAFLRLSGFTWFLQRVVLFKIEFYGGF